MKTTVKRSIGLAVLFISKLVCSPLCSAADGVISVRGRVLAGTDRAHFTEHRAAGIANGGEWLGIKTGDFNGDGRDDILSLRAEERTFGIFLSQADFNFRLIFAGRAPESLNWPQSMSGDVNGDGCADILGPDSVWMDWYVLLSNCRDGFAKNGSRVFPDRSSIRTAVPYSDFRRLLGAEVIEDRPVPQRPIGHTLRVTDGKLLHAKTHVLIHDSVDLLSVHSPAVGRAPIEFFQNETEILTPPVTWASFPSVPRKRWDSVLFGDFNGDGFTDAIARNPSLIGWWLASSNGETVLEEPLKDFPLGTDVQPAAAVAGDFDGDGIDEVLFADKNFRNVSVFKQHMQGVSGVRIEAENGMEALSDAEGRFELPLPVANSNELTAVSEQWIISPRTRRVSSQVGGARPVVFIAWKEPDTPKHAAVTRFPARAAGPSVCINYREQVLCPGNKWGRTIDTLCPEGYVYLETSVMKHDDQLDRVMVEGTCCKLPADDILGAETVQVDRTCPDGFVATGNMRPEIGIHLPMKLFCRKINESRYQLAAAQSGIYWGTRRYPYDKFPGVERSALPLAVRFGFGRLSYQTWDYSGCTGSPVGSLLVSLGKRCTKMQFRQLQYRGMPNDPPAGTPVKMFPDCKKLGNIFDPMSGCSE